MYNFFASLASTDTFFLIMEGFTVNWLITGFCKIASRKTYWDRREKSNDPDRPPHLLFWSVHLTENHPSFLHCKTIEFLTEFSPKKLLFYRSDFLKTSIDNFFCKNVVLLHIIHARVREEFETLNKKARPIRFFAYFPTKNILQKIGRS